MSYLDFDYPPLDFDRPVVVTGGVEMPHEVMECPLMARCSLRRVCTAYKVSCSPLSHLHRSGGVGEGARETGAQGSLRSCFLSMLQRDRLVCDSA